MWTSEISATVFEMIWIRFTPFESIQHYDLVRTVDLYDYKKRKRPR